MRKLPRIIGAVSAALVLTAGLSVSGPAVAQENPVTTAAVNLRVMTWNVPGATKMESGLTEVAQLVNANKINILTVQEMHRVPDRDQVRLLAERLGWYRGDWTDYTHFGPADHPGPCGDERPGWAGNAIFTKFRILERVTIELPPRLDCPVHRSMAGVKLDLGDGRFIRVWTSHFTPGNDDRMTEFRQMQARAVIDYLRHTGPLVFTGDLNARPGGELYDWFPAAGWLDAAKNAGPTHGDYRIDYIWTKRVAIMGAKVVSHEGLSDHRPVIVSMNVA